MVQSNVHENDPEVCSTQIQGQKFSNLVTRGQLPNVGREALDGGGLVALGIQALLDGLPQQLFHFEAANNF